MATVFTIAQQKGGAGKSTLAAHLAIAWATRRKSVALVDIDPQGSLTDWYAIRAEALGQGRSGLTFENVTGWRAARHIDALLADHDIVVVDSPPHAETDAKVAIRAANMVVVPVQPSPMDIWATRPTLDLAAKQKSDVALVLNRVPPRANLTDRMIDRLGDYDVRLAKARLGNRVAFAEAMAHGLTALETKPSAVAAREVKALATELLKLA